MPSPSSAPAVLELRCRACNIIYYRGVQGDQDTRAGDIATHLDNHLDRCSERHNIAAGAFNMGALASAMPKAAPRRCKPKVNNDAVIRRRIDALAMDPWVKNFDKHRVLCAGCGKIVRLDARSVYFPGLWIKHMSRCFKVRDGEVESIAEDN